MADGKDTSSKKDTTTTTTTETVYTFKVINIHTHLNIRSGAGTEYSVVGKLNNGDKVVADKVKTVGSINWYRIKGTKTWVASGNGKTKYLKMTGMISAATATKVDPKDDKADKKKDDSGTKVHAKTGKIVVEKDLNKKTGLGIPDTSDLTKEEIKDTKFTASSKNHWVPNEFLNQVGKGDNVYPKKEYIIKTRKVKVPIKIVTDKKGKKKTIYDEVTVTKKEETGDIDYSIVYTEDILKKYENIKKNLSIPSSLTKQKVTRYNHIYFNRFRIEHPDLYLKNTVAAVFFTRPDLNLFSSDSIVRSQIKVDPRDYWILKQDIDLGRMLVANGGGNETKFAHHNFNPLLSNLAQSLEIQDDSVDTIETGETFTGYKMQYSKHSNKSVTAGQMSIKFKETAGLSITNMHQLWVDYQSNVYKGIYEPKRKHIWRKELDYACNIYYFLLDQDGETILFWSKYYGCFPVNVPKSSFSFDYGSQVSFPELNVSYNYVYKSDLSIRSLVEFNHDAGDKSAVDTYTPIYAGTGTCMKDHSSKTWVGVPFISSEKQLLGQRSITSKFKNDTVVGKKSDVLKLRYMPRSDS